MTSRPGATAFDPETEAAITDIKRMRDQMKRKRGRHGIKEGSATDEASGQDKKINSNANNKDNSSEETKLPEGVKLADFVAYMPSHSYIYTLTREMWPAASVNSRIPPVVLVNDDGRPIVDDKGKTQAILANAWIDKNNPVEQMTWAPGEPMLIKDRLIANGGWIHQKGVTCFNQYKPPNEIEGDPSKAGRWVQHARKLYNDEADHIIKYFAFKIRKPDIKINHAMLIGGKPGIGKDTLIEPLADPGAGRDRQAPLGLSGPPA